ncbi:MAG: cytochrome o ubiquinol oxidase subunit III [Candidatus Saccharibacteria bacterium]|nr:cytochrome o ubiquinol oxidase subunit III [Candidatus Saccharibacteria bacterium]
MSELKDNSTANFGFWIYLMTDAVLFASFFAVYAVMQNNTYGGPAGIDIFDLKFVLIESLILLTSSYTCGLTILAAKKGNKKLSLTALATTGLLGLSFLGMELYEFSHLVNNGEGWTRSGYLTSFFGLVGLHGLHIIVGILWLVVLKFLIIKRGLTESTTNKLALFSMYWHFLDIIWIFIFTFVYGMGVIK